MTEGIIRYSETQGMIPTGIPAYQMKDLSADMPLDATSGVQGLASELPLPQPIQDISDETGLQPPSNVYLGIGKDYSPETPDDYREAAGEFDRFLEMIVQLKLFPKTWKDFQALWINLRGKGGEGLYEGLLKDFAAAMGLQLDSSNNIIGGDWADLSPPINLNDPKSPYNPLPAILNSFILALSTLKPPPTTSKEFITQFQQFAASMGSLLLHKDKAYIDPTSPNQDFFKDRPSFEDYYKLFAYYPSEEELKELLVEFFMKQIQEKGIDHFLPSGNVGDWVDFIKDKVNREPPPIGEIPNDDDKIRNDPLVLNRILDLIMKLTQTVQKMAIIQSNHLTFTTQYQAYFSTLQSQVPIFLKGTEGTLGRDGEAETDLRNNLNTSFNANLIENLRIRRGLQEDTAKREQSQINTSTDFVNQITDILTTFLQQLTTIFSTLFR